MSYDLRIWSSKRIPSDYSLLIEYGYKESADCFIQEGKGWQVVINNTDKVELEDIPAPIMQALPGIAFLTEINIEGRTTEKLVNGTIKFCKTLAREMKGIIEDPQDESILTPSGIKRLSYDVSNSKKQLVSLFWFFEDLQNFYSSKLNQLLDCFKRLMPDALPKRYGQYEPPQFKLAEHGIEHLITFLQNEENYAVLYPSRPFTHLSIMVPNIVLETKNYIEREISEKQISQVMARAQNEFRCGKIELQMLQSVFLQPDWNLAVKRLFIEVSKIIKPFYAEIVEEPGEISAGEYERRKKLGLQRSWWWKGIPSNLGCAVIIGDKYINEWKNFKKIAVAIDSNAWMIDCFGDSNYKSIDKKIGSAPKKLIVPKGGEKIAKFFPFQKGIKFN